MSLTADDTILIQSMMNVKPKTPFIEKRVSYVQDQNGGSYNGQITFDTTTLSNSARWVDYSEGILVVPLAISMTSPTDITASANPYMVALKSGAFNVIDSINVDYLSRNVVQQQSFTNFYVNYKLLSEFSQDDLEKYGDLISFWPDSEASYRRITGAPDSAAGTGLVNNKPYENSATRAYTAATPIQTSNEGMRKRLASTANYATGNGGVNFLDAGARNQQGSAYFVQNGSAGSAIYTWYMLATIRLKDVSDFFAKVPLLRGAQLRIQVNYNAARVAITTTNAPTMVVGTLTQLNGSTVPFMVSSAEANEPSNASVVAAAATGLTFEYNVQKTVSPACGVNPALNSCRIYVPTYTLASDVETRYLESSPVKSILYDDLYQYKITTPGTSVNAILTNGIINPQKLIIIPFVDPGTGATQSGSAQAQFQNPFDSAPGTTGPNCSITNFQVQISGLNMFDHPVFYTFEEFQQEVAQSGLDGGITTGMCSGLISKSMFENSFCYYVCDISRRFESEDTIAKSVQVSFTNNTSASVSYYCFVVYRRSLDINLSTGIPV